MNTLTETEVAQEVAKIRNKEAWPLWPVLPMKNINRSNPNPDVRDGLGILAGYDLTTVYILNLLELKPGPLRPQLEAEGVESVTFDSVEDMVHAGWIGD